MTTPKKATAKERAARVAAQALTAARAVGEKLAKIEHTDWSFFGGLFLIHDGLWREFGVGVANVVTGIVLVATPLILILQNRKKV